MRVFPGLLDASLQETGRLRSISGSVTLKLTGCAEAAFSLPEDTPAVHVHDWVSVYTQRGPAGIFRVSNVARNLKKQVDITLLHGIDILSDSVWAEKTTFTGTKAAFLAAILSRQTHLINGVKPWVLGSCADTSSVEKDINYSKLSSLLQELEDPAGAYCFVYDQSAFPWTVSLIEKPSGVDSEFRLTRNVRSASVTFNDADLCTRLILAVEGVPGVMTYDNQEAQAEYGIVTKTATAETGDPELWAEEFLARRAAPSVQIQIDGDELAQLTGDSWDELNIGRLCRVALPAYGHTFEERVVSVTYPDLIRQPSHVTVSLANALPQFSETIMEQIRETGRAAGAAIRQAEEEMRLELSFAQSGLYSAISISAEALESEFYAADSAIYSTITQTAGGLRAEFGNSLSGVYSSISATASSLETEFHTADSAIYSTITQTAGSIRSELHSAESALSSSITQQAGRIDMVVTGSGQSASIRIDAIVDAINAPGSTVTIEADHINLDGYVTATQLDARMVNADALFSQTGYVGTITASSISASGNIVGSGAVFGTGFYIGTDTPYTDVSNAVASFGTPTSSGGQINIPFTRLSGGTGSINFNIADTQFYKDGVSAAYTSGQNNVSAFADGLAYDETINFVNNKLNLDIKGRAGLTKTSQSGTSSTTYSAYTTETIAVPLTPGTVSVSARAWDPTTKKIPLTGTGSVDADGVTINLTSGTGEVSVVPGAITVTPGTLNTGTKKITIYGSGSVTIGSVPVALDQGTAEIEIVPSIGSFIVGNWSSSTNTVSVSALGAATVGSKTVYSSRQGEDILIVPGTATPNTPVWDSTNHVYNITADGDVTINGTSAALGQGSIAGGFYPQDAIDYGISLGGGGSVGIVKGTWSYGQNTFTLSASSQATSASVNLSLNVPEGTAAAATLAIQDGGTSTGYTKTLTLQDNGDNVTLMDTDFDRVVARIPVSGGGGGGTRSVQSLSAVVLASTDTGVSEQTTTVTYDDGQTGLATISVDASAISAGTIRVQTNRTYQVTANDTYTIQPSSGYDAMSSVSVVVTVPGGTTAQRTASGLADTIVLTASDTGTSTKYETVLYDDDSESANFPVRINAAAVWQAGYNAGAGGGATYQVVPSLTVQGTPYRFAYRTLYGAGQTVTAFSGSKSTVWYRGSGGYYLRGNALTRKVYGSMYTMGAGNTPIFQGTGSWFLISGQDVDTVYRGNGTQLAAGSGYIGDGYTYTAIGSPVNAYVRDNSGSYTYYGAGTTYTNYYYTKNS